MQLQANGSKIEKWIEKRGKNQHTQRLSITPMSIYQPLSLIIALSLGYLILFALLTFSTS